MGAGLAWVDAKELYCTDDTTTGSIKTHHFYLISKFCHAWAN